MQGENIYCFFKVQYSNLLKQTQAQLKVNPHVITVATILHQSLTMG